MIGDKYCLTLLSMHDLIGTPLSTIRTFHEDSKHAHLVDRQVSRLASTDNSRVGMYRATSGLTQGAAAYYCNPRIASS